MSDSHVTYNNRSTSHSHSHDETDSDHESVQGYTQTWTDENGFQHEYNISDEKLQKVKDYCEQLCDFGFEPDDLCLEFNFTC